MAKIALLSATEHVTVEIRELIESGALAPGERVNSDKLSEDLGVSRTPVREALHRLRSEGLVSIIPRVGVFVRRISKKEVEEVYALKAKVEPLAASWAAIRGGSDSEKNQILRHALNQLRESVQSGDVALSAEHIDEIHNEIFALADSEVLSEAYRVFHARVRLFRNLNIGQPGRLAISLQHHEKVVDAIVSGRAEDAANSMEAHLVDASRSAIKVAE